MLSKCKGCGGKKRVYQDIMSPARPLNLPCPGHDKDGLKLSHRRSVAPTSIMANIYGWASSHTLHFEVNQPIDRAGSPPPRCRNKTTNFILQATLDYQHRIFTADLLLRTSRYSNPSEIWVVNRAKVGGINNTCGIMLLRTVLILAHRRRQSKAFKGTEEREEGNGRRRSCAQG